MPIVLVACVLAFTVAAIAQGKPDPQTPAEKVPVSAVPQAREADARLPLRVTVVISRVVGQKKITSVPYMLGVTADGPKTTLRMGVEVPVPMGGGAGGSVSYRSVGTTIDCEARSTQQSGMYRLFITVADSSVHLDPETAAPATSQSMPSFRSFNATFLALLRDGQSSQYASATDPVTGEVMTIDVTVNTLK